MFNREDRTMLVYQNDTPLSRPVQYTPVREVRMAMNGRLLSAGAPRYDTLQAYIHQFAAPLSTLRGAGLWSFYDPIHPELTLLVECEAEPVCERCTLVLDTCHCPF
jgi:hypothetical protein